MNKFIHFDFVKYKKEDKFELVPIEDYCVHRDKIKEFYPDGSLSTKIVLDKTNYFVVNLSCEKVFRILNQIENSHSSP